MPRVDHYVEHGLELRVTASVAGVIALGGLIWLVAQGPSAGPSLTGVVAAAAVVSFARFYVIPRYVKKLKQCPPAESAIQLEFPSVSVVVVRVASLHVVFLALLFIAWVGDWETLGYLIGSAWLGGAVIAMMLERALRRWERVNRARIVRRGGRNLLSSSPLDSLSIVPCDPAPPDDFVEP